MKQILTLFYSLTFVGISILVSKMIIHWENRVTQREGEKEMSYDHNIQVVETPSESPR